MRVPLSALDEFLALANHCFGRREPGFARNDARHAILSHVKLDVDDLRDAVARLPVVPPPDVNMQPVIVSAMATGTNEPRRSTRLDGAERKGRTQRGNRSGSGLFIGAEHRVRTGDLRLGKANRRSQQRFPLLTNHHQPSEKIRRAQRMLRGRITKSHQRSTTVLFHRCSKMAPARSTWLRRPCSLGGRRTPSALLATTEIWRIRETT